MLPEALPLEMSPVEAFLTLGEAILAGDLDGVVINDRSAPDRDGSRAG